MQNDKPNNMRKLLTNDSNLIKEVENVLTEKGIQFVTYKPDKDRTIIEVRNQDRQSLYEATKMANKNPECYAINF